MIAEPRGVPAPLRSRTLCQGLHAGLALLALLAVVGQLLLTLSAPADAAGAEGGVITRLVRFFSYFTIDSNLMVAISAIPLACGARLGPIMRVIRLNAIPCILVTGVVHWFLLRPQIAPTGIPAVLDHLLHIVVPILAVLFWLLSGPRGLIGIRDVLSALIFPILYATWTFAHGAVSAWYPYPFIDVGAIGYGAALGMAALVLAVVLTLTVIAWVLDRILLPQRERDCATMMA